jgi:tripartite-type tricarboxylate transporter receptor subunit TctC
MTLNWKRLAIAVIVAPCLLIEAMAAAAEDYPTKPVRVLVGFPPGSVSDVVSRIIANALSAQLGQPFIVENRGGANAIIATTAVAKSKPDGYTLLGTNSSSMTITPLLYKDSPFDTVKDFAPIMPVILGHYTAVVNPTNPRTASVNSFKDFIALAKAQPGMLTYSVANTGSYGHLTTERVSQIAGIRMTHVPYKSSSAAQTALLTNEVDFTFDTPNVITQIKAGKLKALAVTIPKRWSELPDIPALAEFYPGFDASFWSGFLTRAGTPDDIVQLLNRAIIAATNQPDVRKQLALQGAITTMSPQAFAANISAEIAQNADVIRRANIKIE